MALSASTVKLMGLTNSNVFPLLTDSFGAVDGATYGAGVDLPGIMSIKITPTLQTKDLLGDSRVMDTYSRITDVVIEVENAVMSMEGLAIIQGGTIVTDGTGAAEKIIYSLTADNVTPPYFKIEGLWDYFGDTQGGSAHVVLHKCKTTTPPTVVINDANGDFGTVSFTAKAIVTNSNGKWMDILLNATAEPIPATFPTPVVPTP